MVDGTMEKMNEFETHVREHMTNWPATKEQVIDSFKTMEGVTDEDVSMVTGKLSDKTYNSADEVIEEMKKEEEAM